MRVSSNDLLAEPEGTPGPAQGELATMRETEFVICDEPIDGTFRSRFNGATYDAVEVWSPGEEPAPHNGLELMPGALIPAGPSEIPHRHVLVPAPESDLAGQPVVARLDPDRLTADMYLPPGEQERAFEGALRLVVWERGRSHQWAGAAGYVALAALLLTIGLWRLRWH